MDLHERLQPNRGGGGDNGSGPLGPAGRPDPFSELKNNIHLLVIGDLGPQLFNVTHLLEYWYGVTWNATRRFLARWKQTPDEAYRFAVQAFFERTDFLRTLQHWILFYVEDSETKKSVLRQHQRRFRHGGGRGSDGDDVQRDPLRNV